MRADWGQHSYKGRSSLRIDGLIIVRILKCAIIVPIFPHWPDDEKIMAATATRTVIVLVESSRAYGRGLLRGIARYNREHGPWSIYLQPHDLGAPLPAWL